jgi:hypothetical protein
MDWLVHVGLMLLVTLLFKVRKKGFLLVGSILPDLFSKMTYLLRIFYGTGAVQYLGTPSHTFIGVLLLCIGIALMFKDSKKIFYLLLIGSLTHLFLDMLAADKDMMVFWPVSWTTWGFDIVPNEYYYFPIIIIYPLIFCYFVAQRIFILKRK